MFDKTITIFKKSETLIKVNWKSFFFYLPRTMLAIYLHILCKESIVMVKKFDFEIWTYLYILRSPEFIYVIFTVMYVCMCVCVCACVYVSEHDSI